MERIWDDKIGDVWLHTLVTEKIIAVRYPEWFSGGLESLKREWRCILWNRETVGGKCYFSHIFSWTWLRKYELQEDNKKKL